METNLPVPRGPDQLAAETKVFLDYLESLGLPSENVIASTVERKVVGDNLPDFILSLGDAEKRDARYLSKFVGATVVGLFDAALNYVWNEVVLNLRKKAEIYGVDLFFDAAVGGPSRANFKDKEDLDGLKDRVLLDTCSKLELISEVVYKKLEFILTMRNEVAASHPNVASIGGFELLGWLQTCVKDVLQDRPSESAIRIKALVENIKALATPIDQQTATRFKDEAANLSRPHINNLLVTLFGIFVAPATGNVLRSNIASIAPSIWQFAGSGRKLSIGATIDGYRTNLESDKLAQGIEFLNIVDGRMYETLPARTIQLELLADKLADAHQGYDNYYNEPTVMREILRFFATSSDIPKDVLPKLTRTVLRCRIGRGLSYMDGVSPAGMPLYDRFLGLLTDDGIIECVKALFRSELNVKLELPICLKHLQSVLEGLRQVAVADRVKEILDFLLKDIPTVRVAHLKREFRDLSSPFISWK